MPGNIIHLNVGGMKYCTSSTTLKKYPDSMLACMFSNNMPTQVDKDGCYFIDRNGKIFEYVLQFLRSDKLVLPDKFQDLNLLKCEADFYQLEVLFESILSYERELFKDHENQTICISFIYRNIRRANQSAEGAGKYAINSMLCKNITGRAFEKIHEQPKEFSYNELHDVNCKQIMSHILDETWELENEKKILSQDKFVAFLLSTGFDEKTSSLLLETSRDLFETTLEKRIDVLYYKRQ